MTFRPFAAALLLAAVAARTPAADPPAGFFVQPKDRVLFLGDSITEQYQYSSYIELYLTTRFPKAELTFLNAGISGDTANGGAGRFATHVLAEKPTAVTINFGMNDGGYGAFDANRNKQFVQKTEAMLDAAKKAGVKVALISPNAVDRRIKTNGVQYLETQKQFYAPLAEAAARFGFPFVDQYAITRAELERMEKDDPEAKRLRPFGDGFHTSSPGGLLMAHAILTGLKAPAVVSEVTVDAAANKSTAAGATVADLTASADGVSFTRTDEAIPVPVQKDWVPMLPYLNALDDLNRYTLTVTGLKPGTYAVKVDGVEVARHSAGELAAGLNLGLSTGGPVWEQGQKVKEAIDAKNKLVHARFRGVVMFQTPDWLADVAAERKAKELATRLEKIAAAQADVYKLAQPKPRKVEVVAAK